MLVTVGVVHDDNAASTYKLGSLTAATDVRDGFLLLEHGGPHALVRAVTATMVSRVGLVVDLASPAPGAPSERTCSRARARLR